MHALIIVPLRPAVFLFRVGVGFSVPFPGEGSEGEQHFLRRAPLRKGVRMLP
jgi:hypothetical protein